MGLNLPNLGNDRSCSVYRKRHHSKGKKYSMEINKVQDHLSNTKARGFEQGNRKKKTVSGWSNLT